SAGTATATWSGRESMGMSWCSWRGWWRPRGRRGLDRHAAQLALEDLAKRVAGELVGAQERHGLDALERGQLLPHDRADVVLDELLAVLGHDVGLGDLAEPLVRAADDVGLGRAGVLHEHEPDLGGEDVVPAAYDHVLVAV